MPVPAGVYCVTGTPITPPRRLLWQQQDSVPDCLPAGGTQTRRLVLLQTWGLCRVRRVVLVQMVMGIIEVLVFFHKVFYYCFYLMFFELSRSVCNAIVMSSLERRDLHEAAALVHGDSDDCLLLTVEAQESVSELKTHICWGLQHQDNVRVHSQAGFDLFKSSYLAEENLMFGQKQTGQFVYPGPAGGFFLFLDANVKICRWFNSVLFVVNPMSQLHWKWSYVNTLMCRTCPLLFSKYRNQLWFNLTVFKKHCRYFNILQNNLLLR